MVAVEGTGANWWRRAWRASAKAGSVKRREEWWAGSKGPLVEGINWTAAASEGEDMARGGELTD